MTDRVAIHLHDQAPRIGAGHRFVNVGTIGRKWVRVTYRPGGPDGPTIRQRFDLRTWGIIQIRPQPDWSN